MLSECAIDYRRTDLDEWQLRHINCVGRQTGPALSPSRLSAGGSAMLEDCLNKPGHLRESECVGLALTLPHARAEQVGEADQ